MAIKASDLFDRIAVAEKFLTTNDANTYIRTKGNVRSTDKLDNLAVGHYNCGGSCSWTCSGSCSQAAGGGRNETVWNSCTFSRSGAQGSWKNRTHTYYVNAPANAKSIRLGGNNIFPIKGWAWRNNRWEQTIAESVVGNPNKAEYGLW